jgi:hypothetical protein
MFGEKVSGSPESAQLPLQDYGSFLDGPFISGGEKDNFPQVESGERMIGERKGVTDFHL